MGKRANVIGTTITLDYGTIEITGFAGGWRAETYRPFEVHPSEPWTKEVYERTMVADHSDATTRHDKQGAGYDARCSCCWLNITHSEAKHAASVSAVVAATPSRGRFDE